MNAEQGSFFIGADDFTRTKGPNDQEKMSRVACLCSAVVTGDVEIVRALLGNGFDVNEVFENLDVPAYLRPLSYAVLDGNEDMTRFLIDEGAEIGNAPLVFPEYGVQDLLKAMALPPKKAIASIVVQEAIHGRLREVSTESRRSEDVRKKLAGAEGTNRFILLRSPLTAACFVKSQSLVKLLLDSGAEFGEYYHFAINAVLDETVPCDPARRRGVLQLVLEARDRIGFDRFVSATDDFEQYVNGEWRRNLENEDYSPALSMQEKAWAECDRLLTSPAFRKELPISQLLYKKFRSLTLDDVIGKIEEACEMVDSSPSLNHMQDMILVTGLRRRWGQIMSPLFLSVERHPKTHETVIAVFPRCVAIGAHFDGLTQEYIELLKGKTDKVKLDLEKFTKTLEELGFPSDDKNRVELMSRTFGSKHSIADLKELFPLDDEFRLTLFSTMTIGSFEGLWGQDPEKSVFYDEEAVERVLGFWNEEHFEQIGNYVKCAYAASLSGLVQAEAEERTPTTSFSSFSDACGWLVSDELSPVYLRSRLDEGALSDLKDVFQNIKLAYRCAISGSHHLSEESRLKAIRRLENMELAIVGAESVEHKLGQQPVIDDWDFVDNVSWLIGVFDRESYNCWLSGEDVPTSYSVFAWTYNAAYTPIRNKVVLCAAYLTPPIYSPYRANVMNYAAMGRVLAHEVSHAFDPHSVETFRLFNDSDALDIFSSSPDYALSIEKLKAQFKNRIPRRLVLMNPMLSLVDSFDYDKFLGENFADLAGLEISLLAYALSAGFNTVEELVCSRPDDVRLFMQSYAMSFRSKPSITWLAYQMMEDVHAPDELRANTVKNLDAFHQVFNTKEGDGMWLDPEDRVSIFGIC